MRRDTRNRTPRERNHVSRQGKKRYPILTNVTDPTTKPGRSGRSKFTELDHEGADGIPEMVLSWKTVWQNTTGPNNTSKKPWGYFVPDANMLMAPAKAETRSTYVKNWTRIRIDWLLLVIDDKRRRMITSTSWREYLAFGANPRKENHMDVLKALKEVWGMGRKDVARQASTWSGEELAGEVVGLRTCREITWELCQIGFRYELLTLDSIIVRREGPKALDIWAERIEWINEVCGDDWLTRSGPRTTDLASSTAAERSRPLRGLTNH